MLGARTMTHLFSFLKSLSCRQVLSGTPKYAKNASCHHSQAIRAYADTPKSDPNNKIAIRKVQGTENDKERLHVRRARPADVPRVLRFVRSHARDWPGPPALQTSQLVLGDYVARALAQGHSMIAEQQEQRRSWSQIKGLALGSAVVPWDAALLERFARCVKCMRSRRLMQFTAHCLRAPALHHKYGVHRILQVMLIVPAELPKSSEVIQVLAKNTIARGKEAGFPLVRFDVTCVHVAKSLEELELNKEWQLSYNVLPEKVDDTDLVRETKDETTEHETGETKKEPKKEEKPKDTDGSFVAVYTALTTTKS